MDTAPLIRKERHEINRHRLLREVTPLVCPTAVQQVQQSTHMHPSGRWSEANLVHSLLLQSREQLSKIREEEQQNVCSGVGCE